jgi:heme exporter protein C
MSPKSRILTVLDIITALLMAGAIYMVFFYAPREATMGEVQRVFYFHVSTAWVGMLGFLAAGISGVAYLVTKDQKWDTVEVASVEISLVFFFIAIALGSIWARPSWGKWWTGDPRLTSAAVAELIYAAYFMLRQGIEDPDRRARFGAIYTLLGAFSVPITFLTIRLLRTIHPVVIGTQSGAAQGGFNMDSPMKITFFFSLFVFSVLFVDLFWHRIRLGQFAQRVEQLKLKWNG